MKKIITIFILFTAFIACCFAAVSCKSSRATAITNIAKERVVRSRRKQTFLLSARPVRSSRLFWQKATLCI